MPFKVTTDTWAVFFLKNRVSSFSVICYFTLFKLGIKTVLYLKYNRFNGFVGV